MAKHASQFALIALLAAAACSQRTAVPAGPSTVDVNAGGGPVTAQSQVTHGYFTEYSIPAGVHPDDLTRGPYDSVYFTSSGLAGLAPNVYEMAASTGSVHTFTAPAPYRSTGFGSIISLNRSVYWVVKIPINEDEFFFARVTPEGAFSFQGAAYFEYGILTNLAQIPNTSNFTYGYCADPCQSSTAGIVNGANFDSYFVPTAITGGPGGDIYATATCHGPCAPPTDSRVYVISPAGAILHKYNLANGSLPEGIVTGSDHNLWITEQGTNKIARMTPAGVITEYKVPTATSGLDRITYGYDSAQYFTETTANKIGRITTAGVITEYAIPTATSGATGITPCGSSVCGTHGGVWFTETNANKIGRLNAPV